MVVRAVWAPVFWPNIIQGRGTKTQDFQQSCSLAFLNHFATDQLRYAYELRGRAKTFLTLSPHFDQLEKTPPCTSLLGTHLPIQSRVSEEKNFFQFFFERNFFQEDCCRRRTWKEGWQDCRGEYRDRSRNCEFIKIQKNM